MSEARGESLDIPLVQHQIHGTEEVVYARDNEALIAHLSAIITSQNVQIDNQVAEIAELDHAAHHDELTGLPNRRGLRRSFNEHIDNGNHFALEISDIVNFKAVNETAGYNIGDKFLSKVLARDIFSHVRKYDVPVALRTRLGGDEFGALVILKQRESLKKDGMLVPNEEELSESEQLEVIEKRLAKSFKNHPFVKLYNSFMPDDFKLGIRSHSVVYNGQSFEEFIDEASPEETKDPKRSGFPVLTAEQREELRQILQQ